MTARYLNERAALAERVGETVEITIWGGPRTFMALDPTADEYVALARTAYLRDDLTADEFEAELDRAYQQ